MFSNRSGVVLVTYQSTPRRTYSIHDASIYQDMRQCIYGALDGGLFIRYRAINNMYTAPGVALRYIYMSNVSGGRGISYVRVLKHRKPVADSNGVTTSLAPFLILYTINHFKHYIYHKISINPFRILPFCFVSYQSSLTTRNATYYISLANN